MKKELKWNSEIRWIVVLFFGTFISAYAISRSLEISVGHGLGSRSGVDWGAILFFISIPLFFFCGIMSIIGLFKKSKDEIKKYKGKWKWYSFSITIFCFGFYSLFQLLMIFNLADDFKNIDLTRESWRLVLFIPSLWITIKGIKYRLTQPQPPFV